MSDSLSIVAVVLAVIAAVYTIWNHLKLTFNGSGKQCGGSLSGEHGGMDG
jgi:Flp pilus assembly pilin Flp